MMQGADYNKLERNEAKRIGAKQHKNSGRNMVKADMSTDLFVIDAKFAKKSFTINEDIWAKICTDAMSVDKKKSPMLYLVIGNIRLAVIEYDILEEIVGE